MKRIRMGFTALALITGLVSAFAFTPAKPALVTGEKWFEFTNDLEDNDESNPANYTLYGDGSAAPACSGSVDRCGVYVIPDGDQPDQTSLDNVSGGNIVYRH